MTTSVLRGCMLAAIVSQMAAGAILNSKFRAGGHSLQRVCIFPAEASLFKYGMKGVEPLQEESQAWALKLQDVVADALEQLGAQVTAVPQQGQSAHTILQVKQKYDSVATLMDRRPNGVQKGRYTLGDEVAILPCSARADAVVFIEAQGTSVTGGRRAFGIATLGPLSLLSEYGVVRLAIADSVTGEFVGFSKITVAGKATFADDPERAYRGSIKRELAKIIKTRRPAGQSK